MKKLMLRFIVAGSVTVGVIGCGGGSTSYSLLASEQVFQQTSVVNTKVDILWMVDGSGTMANHQANLAGNFDHFIRDFTAKGLDYHMAVASTDAWLRERNYNGGTCTSNPNPSLSPNTTYVSSADCQATAATFGQLTHFRDGDIYGPVGGAGTRSGTYLLTSLMDPQAVMNLFSINIRTGTRGDGSREAGFQSLRSVLRRNEDGSPGYGGETHTALSQFRRDDAFLAVIMVTDEEDQSRKMNNTTYSSIQEYTNAFLAFMDGYTGSSQGNRNYNVSGIVLENINNCVYGLHEQATQGNRYVSIANATNGIVGNICSADFSTQLTDISARILSLATRFQLDSEPAVGSIKVIVSGSIVPEGATNGWTYYAESGNHFVQFHGSAIPPQDARIVVNYDPVSLNF